MALNDREKERYARQLIVPFWDQEKLKTFRVLIAGVGGLGSASSLYLALAGVGILRLCDADRVNRADLNRQVLYTEFSVGLPKVEEAKRRLAASNPYVLIEPVAEKIHWGNVGALVQGCSLIIDGLDNVESRLVLSEQAAKSRIPYVYGAVQGWQGMVGLFNPPKTACLACLLASVSEAPAPIPVFGAMPGTIALLQATEALKFLLGAEQTLEGRLLIYDSLTLTFDIMQVSKDPSCPVCSPLRL